ncbi:MAG: hypothetical protein WCS37_06090 [Chloroflexota bacterium]
MPQKKFLSLTCPVCETKLKLVETITYVVCPSCEAELNVTNDEGKDHLESVETAEAARFSPQERELILINAKIRAKDDRYGMGCAIATLVIAGLASISMVFALDYHLTFLLGLTVFGSLVSLGLVLVLFTSASNHKTQPLARQREQLLTAIGQPSGAEIQDSRA